MLRNPYSRANLINFPFISSSSTMIANRLSKIAAEENPGREMQHPVQRKENIASELTSNGSRRRTGSWSNPAWTSGFSRNRDRNWERKKLTAVRSTARTGEAKWRSSGRATEIGSNGGSQSVREKPSSSSKFLPLPPRMNERWITSQLKWKKEIKTPSLSPIYIYIKITLKSSYFYNFS